MEEDPVVKEAIRRLPPEEQDLRLFRLKRALDLSLKKSVLPREQWTSVEEVSHSIAHTSLHLVCVLVCSRGYIYVPRNMGICVICRFEDRQIGS